MVSILISAHSYLKFIYYFKFFVKIFYFKNYSRCAFEAGSNFNQIGPVDNDLLLKMRELSPLMHAHKVKTPTLLCLGSKDQRVPYYQGIEFYHKIKANGCKAR